MKSNCVLLLIVCGVLVCISQSVESGDTQLDIDEFPLTKTQDDDSIIRLERSADKKKAKQKKRERRRKLAVSAVEKVVRETMAQELEPLNIALSMIQFDTLASGLVRQVSSLEHIQSNLLTEYGELRAAINEIGRHILDLGRQVAGMDERLATLDRQFSHRMNVVNTRSESKSPELSYIADTLRDAALTFSSKLTFAERNLKENLSELENRTVETVKSSQNFLERRLAASAMETESRLTSIEKNLNRTKCIDPKSDSQPSTSDRFSWRQAPHEQTKDEFVYLTPEERISNPERLQREERQHPPVIAPFTGWKRPIEYQTVNSAMISKVATEVVKLLNFETGSKPKDCLDVYTQGNRSNGIYTIYPASCTRRYSIDVFCEMEEAGGGWTVIQRRGSWPTPTTQSGMSSIVSSVFSPVDFFRDWPDYKWGFGSNNGEFWLGNEYIHQLTESGDYELRIELEDWNSDYRWAHYQHFSVDNEKTNYTLHVGDFSGNAGNSLKHHDGASFSTRDRDNDANPRGHCARTFHGAWWFTSCHESHLNGKFHKGLHKSFGDGINWLGFRGHNYSLKKARMMIRPAKKT